MGCTCLYSEQSSYSPGERMVTWKTRINQSNEKRSLIPWGLRMLTWKINVCSKVLWVSVLP